MRVQLPFVVRHATSPYLKILSVQIRRASISCPKCYLFFRFRGIKNEGNKAVLIQKGNCMVKRRKLTRCIEERKVGLAKSTLDIEILILLSTAS